LWGEKFCIVIWFSSANVHQDVEIKQKTCTSKAATSTAEAEAAIRQRRGVTGDSKASSNAR
jgi:hypothetical protein